VTPRLIDVLARCIFAHSLAATNNAFTYEVLLFAVPVGELLGAAVGDIEGETGDAFSVK